MDEDFKKKFREARANRKVVSVKNASPEEINNNNHDARSHMPPPPPRQNSAQGASYHIDSQAGIAATSPYIQSEPSVNNKNTNDHHNAINHSTASNTMAAQGSTENSLPIHIAPSHSIQSVEGSTGEFLVTSATSEPHILDDGASRAIPAVVYTDETTVKQSDATNLPRGFFEDTTASTQEERKNKVEQEFADFMKEVQQEATPENDNKDVAKQGAVGDAENGGDVDDGGDYVRDREDFEHFVRLEHLEELKQKHDKNNTDTSNNNNNKVKTALELAGLDESEVEKPTIRLTKKRKLAQTVALLKNTNNSNDDDSDDDTDDDVLDWRRKKVGK